MCSCSNEKRNGYARDTQETQPEATGALRIRASRPEDRLNQWPKNGWSKACQIAANTKHGHETRAIREERSAKLAELYELEMLGRELGLISGGMVGRKPRGEG